MWVFCLLSFKFSHYYLHLRSKYNHYSSFYYRTQIVPCDTRLCAIQAAVNPSFSTDQDETKLVYIILQRSSAKPVYTHCTCTVGLRKDCSHIGAVLFLLCDIIAEGHEELPVDPTCTDMKCKWTDPKGANCEPKMVEDLHIYKAKFGTKPSSKIVKPSASFANKVFKCDISQDKRLEKKLKLKNDILIANQRDSIPPIFHLIGMPSQNGQNTESQNNCEPTLDTPCEGEQLNDIDLPYCMEIELQETVSFTCQESDQNSSVSKSHRNIEVGDELISPPKYQPVSLSEIKERADKIKRKLFVTPEQKSHIEEETRDQADCEAWYRHRKPRITASKCKRAFIKPTTSPTKAMKEIMGMNSTVTTSFMKDGQLSECGIIEKYSEIKGVKVSKCGLFISEQYPFLAASPDGLVGSHGLVEAKKIHPRENETLHQALLRLHICKPSKETPGELVVNENHRYYFQVQQQLLCTPRLWGDFVASDGKSFYIERLTFDEKFWEERILKLEKFYNDTILLELAYPRVKNGLERIGKFGLTYDNLLRM